MEIEKKLAGKVYQAPVMKSVNVKMQAILSGSCASNTTPVTECTGIFSFGGTCSSNSGGGRAREIGSWDDED